MNEELIGKIIDYTAMIFIALISGVIPIWLSNRKDKRNQRIDTLIDLYKNVRFWCNTAMVNFNNFFLVIDGVNDWNKYLDDIVTYDTKGDPQKIEIVINLYFPKLKPSFDTLHNAIIETYGFIHLKVKEAYEKGEDIQKYRNEFTKKIYEFNSAVEKLENLIMDISKDMSRKYGIMK